MVFLSVPMIGAYMESIAVSRICSFEVAWPTSRRILRLESGTTQLDIKVE